MTSRTYGTATARSRAGWGGIRHGDEVRFAGASKGWASFRSDAPPPGSPNASNSFPVRVTVTDWESGETGAFDFTGRAGLIHGLPMSWYNELLIHADGGASLVLGRNRYSFTIDSGDTDSSAWIFAQVNVSPVTAAPEPGTLALAGPGLAAVGAGRFRRRPT